MRPLVMGVVNVTPDSFSDGGRFADAASAIAHARALIAEGADVIDVGGESSRPGADPVGEAEELDRVIPVVAALAGSVRLSVDTVKPAVARAAVAAGATLVNDVSAGLAPVAAELGVGYVVMHRQGDAATMQLDPHYDDVVAEVRDALAQGAAEALALGIDEIWVDPGIGFGKTAAHNLSLLLHLDAIVALGYPVLVGTSRKGFLGALLAASDGADSPTPTDDRLEGSLATATWAMARGARMIRVHDVAPSVQAAKVVAA
ncbi:MAG: dihydropteroate synthase [Acidimicrobiales bacterium]